MLEESKRGRSADRPTPLSGHSDMPRPTDEKLSVVRHDGTSEDALGKVPVEEPERTSEEWLAKREEEIRNADENL